MFEQHFQMNLSVLKVQLHPLFLFIVVGGWWWRRVYLTFSSTNPFFNMHMQVKVSQERNEILEVSSISTPRLHFLINSNGSKCGKNVARNLWCDIAHKENFTTKSFGTSSRVQVRLHHLFSLLNPSFQYQFIN